MGLDSAAVVCSVFSWFDVGRVRKKNVNDPCNNPKIRSAGDTRSPCGAKAAISSHIMKANTGEEHALVTACSVLRRTFSVAFVMHLAVTRALETNGGDRGAGSIPCRSTGLISANGREE